jgi:hypothetical protein
MGEASLAPQGTAPAPPLQEGMGDASSLPSSLSPFNAPAPPLQGGMEDALLSSLGNLLAPPSQVVPGITAPPADEQKKHNRFIPKPPKRKKQKLRRKKSSNYDYDLARESLGLEANANHLQVFSAAASLSVTRVETPLVNSPTKNEVKFENSILKEDATTYKRKILTLELANKSSTRNAKKLKSQVRSLSDSLNIEKNKSRVAIQQLLTVTTMQHNEMIAKFQAKIGDIQTEHDRALYKLRRCRGNEILNNQKSIERVLKQHSTDITQLESDYQEGLTHMENQHNKSMVSSHDMFFCIEKAVTTLMKPFSVYFQFPFSAGAANDEDGRIEQYL